MRIGIIDLGTNSVRFDVHEIFRQKSGKDFTVLSRRLYREKVMVRLGEQLFRQGYLHPDAVKRTLQALGSFRQTLDALHVDRVVAFGTASLRDAKDSESFTQLALEKAGIQIRTITGQEEAYLIAKGILAHLDLPKKGATLLVDIGGGSTELILCDGNKVKKSHSFNLGVAKLQQLFFDGKQKPNSKEWKRSIRLLRAHIRAALEQVTFPEKWGKAALLLGSSGSISALSKLVFKNVNHTAHTPFRVKQLDAVVKIIEPKSPAQLLNVPGMEAKRVDLILCGAVLLQEIAKHFQSKWLQTTEYSLRDGILQDEIERVRFPKESRPRFELTHLKERIKNWGVDQEHSENVAKNSTWLFDQLQKVHHLNKEDRYYLEAASLLHDVGETISHTAHHEHSEYMIRNANFVGMLPWEAAFISLICRYHKEEKFFEKKLDKKIPYLKKNPLYPRFFGILSLLQMADALDRTHQHHVQLKSCRVKGNQIVLTAISKTGGELEKIRFEQRKQMFERFFKKQIKLFIP